MKPNYKLLGSTMNKIWPNLLYIGAIILIITLFKMSFLTALLFIVFSLGVRMGFMGQFTFKRWLKSAVIIVVMLTIYYYIWEWFGTKSALLAVGLGALLFAAYILWVKRRDYLQVLKEVETMIFGKSLDKKNWRGDKPKWSMKK